jgi:hypothetical protein
MSLTVCGPSCQLCVFRFSSDESKSVKVVAPNVEPKEMAATAKNGHFDSALCGVAYIFIADP